MPQKNFATFQNMSNSKTMNLTLEWNSGTGISFTEIKPGEIAEIVFNDDAAVFCHGIDGDVYNPCPLYSKIAKAGDSCRLYENGKTEVFRDIIDGSGDLSSIQSSSAIYDREPAIPTEPVLYQNFMELGLGLGQGFDPANLSSIKEPAIVFKEKWITGAAAETKSQVIYVSDYEYFARLLKIDTSLSASYLQSSVKADSGKSIAESFSKNSVNILVNAYADYGWFGFEPGAQLTEKADSILKSDQQAFFRMYGTKYVARERRMNSISILITIKSTSQKFKSVISSSLSAGLSYGSLSVGLKQTINEEITRENNSNRIELNVFTIGGKGIESLKDILLPNIKPDTDFLEYTNQVILKNVSSLNEKNAIQFECMAASMENFGSTERAPIQWSYNRVTSMEKLKSMYNELSYHLNVYDNIKNKITPYYELLGSWGLREWYMERYEPMMADFQHILQDIAERHQNCKTNEDENSFRIPVYATYLISNIDQLAPVDYKFTAITDGLMDSKVLETLLNTIPKQRAIDLKQWIAHDALFYAMLRPNQYYNEKKVKIITLRDSLKFTQSSPFYKGVRETTFYNGPSTDFIVWTNAQEQSLEDAILAYIPKIHGNFHYGPTGIFTVEYNYSLFYSIQDIAGRQFSYKIMDLEMVVYKYENGTSESVIRNINYYFPAQG